ncbi:MAG: hypothetical protein SNJ82_14910 [Gemmataceae bacterium]
MNRLCIRVLWLLVGMVGGISLSGCSGGEEPCFPVSGIVVYEDDQPALELVNGSVTFIPQRQGGSPVASGSIGADARFRLSTRRPNDGAVAGTHKVDIQLPDYDALDSDARVRQPPKVRLDPKTLEKLTATVEPRSNDLKIQLKRLSSKSGKSPR